ncbi:hypothetical protein COO60DRAFT_1702769 [Scenedesmus sp. NREL 46B-D3]|nr:hypothetical protein COO60DRAFT_1702769 [Scenedesmus sp. NREL 46B-D3]
MQQLPQQMDGLRKHAACSGPPVLSGRGFGARGAARRNVSRNLQMQRLVVRSAEKAAELLRQGNGKYSVKDLMGALKLYEDVLKQEGVTTRQKQEALYGSTAVHATFGDVELAQITLREGIKIGLDFEQAVNDPEMVEMVTSTQILIQLKRFNQQAQAAVAARARMPPPGAGSSSSSRAKTRPGAVPVEQDLASILGTPDSDTAAIDTSVGAIIRRVLLVLLVGVGLGTALFFAGLETLFPKY